MSIGKLVLSSEGDSHIHSYSKSSSPVKSDSKFSFEVKYSNTAFLAHLLTKFYQKIESPVSSKTMFDFKPLFASASFTDSLRDLAFGCAFKNSKYRKEEDYLSALVKFRADIQKMDFVSEIEKEEIGNIARKIMTLPLLIPGIKIMSGLLPRIEDSMPFSEALKEDRRAIKVSSSEFHEGILHRAFNKAKAKINLFDPHMNGNMPFIVGSRDINGKSVLVLRHGVPTVETLEGLQNKIEIAGEYRAFLRFCKREGEKVLYCSLLDPETSDEFLRLKALDDLAEEEAEVFHYLRIPLDGSLCNMDSNLSLEEYKEAIEANIKYSIGTNYFRKGDFIFSSEIKKIVEKSYKEILNCAYLIVLKDYDVEKIDEREMSKQSLFILFSVLLRQKLIKDLGVRYYNNTCKDAIDRGAVHMVADLLWDNFLTDQLNNSDTRHILRVLAAWPAFMAKTQSILSKRSKWLESFALFLEKACTNERRQEIIDFCRKSLDLTISGQVRFDDRVSHMGDWDSTIELLRIKGEEQFCTKTAVTLPLLDQNNLEQYVVQFLSTSRGQLDVMQKLIQAYSPLHLSEMGKNLEFQCNFEENAVCIRVSEINVGVFIPTNFEKRIAQLAYGILYRFSKEEFFKALEQKVPVFEVDTEVSHCIFPIEESSK